MPAPGGRCPWRDWDTLVECSDSACLKTPDALSFRRGPTTVQAVGKPPPFARHFPPLHNPDVPHLPSRHAPEVQESDPEEIHLKTGTDTMAGDQVVSLGVPDPLPHARNTL